jgi:hypothetical protein
LLVDGAQRHPVPTRPKHIREIIEIAQLGLVNLHDERWRIGRGVAMGGEFGLTARRPEDPRLLPTAISHDTLSRIGLR